MAQHAYSPEGGSGSDDSYKKCAVSTADQTNSKVDLLRGLFALFVVLGHAFDVSEQYVNTNSHLGFTLFVTLARIRPLLGFVWVIGFIVLSGFCIEQSCKSADRRGFSLRKFWIARISRLFPVLMISGCVAGAFELAMFGSGFRPHIWEANLDWQHLLITVIAFGGFYGSFSCLAPAYTLSFEILYYLLWSSTRKVFGSSGRALIINLVLVATFLSCLPSISRFTPGWLEKILAPIILICYMSWLIGAALSNHIEVLCRNRLVAFMAKWSWFILLAFMLFAQDDYQCPSFAQDIGRSVAYYCLLGLCFALVIINCYTGDGDTVAPAQKARNRRWGLISYPLYLIHGPIIIFFGFLVNKSGIKVRFDIHWAILIMSALAAALGVVHWVEKPALELRKRYLARL
jgi:peptidoglycan/LPS O-acetylase OafA/YrhL